MSYNNKVPVPSHISVGDLQVSNIYIEEFVDVEAESRYVRIKFNANNANLSHDSPELVQGKKPVMKKSRPRLTSRPFNLNLTPEKKMDNIADLIFAAAYAQEALKFAPRLKLGDEAEKAHISKRCTAGAEMCRDLYLSAKLERDERAFFHVLFSEEMFKLWNDYSVNTREKAVNRILKTAKEQYPEWTEVEESVRQWEGSNTAFFPSLNDRDHYGNMLAASDIGEGRTNLSWERLINNEAWDSPPLKMSERGYWGSHPIPQVGQKVSDSRLSQTTEPRLTTRK